MKDWNQDGEINAKDDAVFHMLIKDSEKKRQHESTSTRKRKTSIPAIIAVLYLAAWISGGHSDQWVYRISCSDLRDCAWLCSFQLDLKRIRGGNMREFDLNIEQILESWEIYHAVREMIANALDEQVLSKQKTFKL